MLPKLFQALAQMLLNQQENKWKHWEPVPSGHHQNNYYEKDQDK